MPASNLIFIRSVGQIHIEDQFDSLASSCWDLHDAVIRELAIRMVVCFGQRCGNFVCDRLKAAEPMGTFEERNRRRWRSRAYRNEAGTIVVVATHPSRANWETASADPTPMIAALLP